MIRLLIVDDTDPVRWRLKSFLEEERDIEVVGEAKTGEEAVSYFSSKEPSIDVILMDYNLGNGINGIEAAEKIKKMKPEIKIIIFSIEADFLSSKYKKKAAVDAFLYKGVSTAEIIECIQAVREFPG